MATGEETIITGATSNSLDNLENGTEYKLVATNTRLPEWTVEDSFVYGNRTVIYVSYSSGNDRNDGYTPQTPVRTLSTAYGKLDRNGTRETNIIVIMNNYSSNSFYNSQNSTTYNRPATLTGMYGGVDYNGRLYFYSGETNYRYLVADTTFMYMDWYGSNDNSWFGRRTAIIFILTRI